MKESNDCHPRTKQRALEHAWSTCDEASCHLLHLVGSYARSWI